VTQLVARQLQIVGDDVFTNLTAHLLADSCRESVVESDADASV